jgi:hypothetical protein
MASRPTEAASAAQRWTHVALTASNKVHSDRCLHFPTPHFKEAPPGFVVVRGNASGTTRLANAALKQAPADADAVSVSAGLVRALRAGEEDEAGSHLLPAEYRRAHLGDIVIYGGPTLFPLWVALIVALAGVVGAIVSFATADVPLWAAITILAAGLVVAAVTGAKDVKAALRGDC